MASKISTSQVHAPNFIGSPISDDDLLGGFLLALWTGGRQEKTLLIFEESVRAISNFTMDLGLPGLATMDRNHVRHWWASLHKKGNKPATISVHYRSLNRFFS